MENTTCSVLEVSESVISNMKKEKIAGMQFSLF